MILKALTMDIKNNGILDKKSAMKNFHITLLQGTDSIKFGMTNKEVQSLMNIQPQSLHSIIDAVKIEYYSPFCKIFYLAQKGNYICSEIEFYSKAQVFLNEIALMGQPEQKIIELFQQRFADYSFDNIKGHRSEKYQIGFGVSDKKPYVVDSVCIARAGYHKEITDLLNKSTIKQPDYREYICLQCNEVILSDNPIVACKKCNILMIPK